MGYDCRSGPSARRASGWPRRGTMAYAEPVRGLDRARGGRPPDYALHMGDDAAAPTVHRRGLQRAQDDLPGGYRAGPAPDARPRGHVAYARREPVDPTR